MGDLVHCLPAITDIHQHYPDAEIHWLAEESFADVARLHCGIAQVMTCAVRRWRRAIRASSTWTEIQQLRHWIQEQGYDCVIDFQGTIKECAVDDR